jgi:hypothetical protein
VCPIRTHVHLLDKRFSLACQQRYGASALPGVQVSRAGQGGGEERAGEKGGVGVADAAGHLLPDAAGHLLPDASESPGLRAGSIQLSLKVTRRLLAAFS